MLPDMTHREEYDIISVEFLPESMTSVSAHEEALGRSTWRITLQNKRCAFFKTAENMNR